MKSLLFYLGQVIICSGILYGYYHFFLRNKKFHLYNRYYLLIATGISIVIPFLNIPVYFSAAQQEHSVIFRTITTARSIHIFSMKAHGVSFFTAKNMLGLFYFSIALFIFIRFVVA